MKGVEELGPFSQEELNLVEIENEVFVGEYDSRVMKNSKTGRKVYLKSTFNEISEKEDPMFFLFLEAIGARFYKYLSDEEIIVPNTYLVSLDDKKIMLASDWIDDFVPYEKLSEREQVSADYITMLVIAKFIGNFDCIGKGINAGALDGDRRKVVKIDPGGSFSFIVKDPLNSIFGSVLHIAEIIQNFILTEKHQIFFESFVQLDMLAHNNPEEIDNSFELINQFLRYYHPDFDTRDLLFGSITYQKILENKKLYNQLAETIHKIVNLSEKELTDLICSKTPDNINGEALSKIKADMLVQLIKRQKVMAQLYRRELKYFELLSGGVESNYEQLQEIVEQSLVDQEFSVIDDSPLMSEDQKREALKEYLKIICDKVISSFKMELLFIYQYFLRMIENNDLEIVSLMIGKSVIQRQINRIIKFESRMEGKEVYTSAFLRAIRHEDLRIAKLLLKNGVNPKKQTQDNGEEHNIVARLPKELWPNVNEALEESLKEDWMDLLIELSTISGVAELGIIQDLYEVKDSKIKEAIIEFFDYLKSSGEIREITKEIISEYISSVNGQNTVEADISLAETIMGDQYLYEIPFLSYILSCFNREYYHPVIKGIWDGVGNLLSWLETSLLSEDSEVTIATIQMLEQVFLDIQSTRVIPIFKSFNSGGFGDPNGDYGGGGGGNPSAAACDGSKDEIPVFHTANITYGGNVGITGLASLAATNFLHQDA